MRPLSVILPETAIYYRSMGISVIPVNDNKRPLIEWAEFQNRIATEEEIKSWWRRYPKAMLGVVTGSLSNLCIIDIDLASAIPEILKLLPPEMHGQVPSARTPRGGMHLYFSMGDLKIGNRAGVIEGVDVRGEGGYAVAPPSQSGRGKPYYWTPGESIGLKPRQMVPPLLLRLINTTYKNTNKNTYSYSLGSYLYGEKGGAEIIEEKGSNVNLSENSNEGSNFANFTLEEMFTEGRRDQDLYHVAHSLLKGGASEEEARRILTMLAEKCDPPFSPEEVQIKVDSALKRRERKHGELAAEVRQWVAESTGIFNSDDIAKALELSSKNDRANLRMILQKLREDRVIEKAGSRTGTFRKIEVALDRIDFLNTDVKEAEVTLPLDLNDLVKVLPKNIIVVAGASNSGKTAFLLNLAKMNMDKHEVVYFSSEMGAVELKDRIMKFGIPLEQWNRMSFYERSSNFADVIKPDGINIIDYLEVNDEFWKVSGMIKDIYDRLDRGIAVIALQKKTGQDVGRGGEFSLEKPRLYLAMDHGEARIIKAKNWRSSRNPNGMRLHFRLVGGAEYHVTIGWHHPEEDD